MRSPSNRTAASRVCRAVLPLLVLGAACHEAPNEPVPSSVTLYGGDNQLAFDTLSHLGAPLAVRVTDGAHPIAGARVQWNVVTGIGDFTSYPAGSPLTDNTTTSDANGIAAVYFRPRSWGSQTVTASVSGAPSVEFHAITNPNLRPPDVLIMAGPNFDCTGGLDPTVYWLDTTPRDTVLKASVGQHVGIRYGTYLSPSCVAQFKSTTVPSGGTAFDSGVIHAGETFVFQPDVAGTWTFVDAINGGSGKLTVRP